MADLPNDDDDHLKLTLGPSIVPPSEQPQPPSAPPANPLRRKNPRQTTARSVRRRKDNGNSETIPPPYPWTTDRACRFHSVAYLKRNGHVSITGNVTCKKCERRYEMAFDLEEKFCEVAFYFLKNKDEMHHRATPEWKNPMMPECRLCGEKNAVSPEIAGSEKTNWLFLFLGQLIGCCGLQDLKYFLFKNEVHRTAGKDWLLYDVYLCILKQLDPSAPF